MHGQDAFTGQEEIHDRKDALFDFPGILRAGNEDAPRFVIDEDGRFRMDAVRRRVAFKARCDDDGEIRVAVLQQLFLAWPDEQIADEQVFTGQFRHDAELLAALLVSAGKAVKNKDFAVLQIGCHLVFQGAELVLCNRAVDAAPGDEVVDPRRIDDEFILWRPAREFSRFYDQCPCIAEHAFAAAQCRFREACRAQIAVYGRRIDDTRTFQSKCFHTKSPQCIIGNK